MYGNDIQDSDFVNALYQNVLGRQGERGGQQYWINY